MYCKKCGRELKDADKFCISCGTQIESFEVSDEKKDIVNNSKSSESKFEKFMSKHIYKNFQELSVDEIERWSVAMSILIILLQLVKVICAFFDYNTSYLFFGELFCVLSDWYFLSKMGVRGVWKVCGLFLYPVYLFIKARKTNRKYIWSIVCAIILIGGWLIIGIDMRENRQDDNLVEYELVQNGALIDMDLDTFSAKFSRVMQNTYLELTGENIYIDLSQYWSNIVPPQTAYEEETGTQFTLYSAFYDNTYLITASVVDDKIRSINVCFDYDDNTIPKVLHAVAMQTVGEMDIYEVNEMCEILENGILDNTMIYKDGILYYIETSTVSYAIMPVSEDFVQRLEDSGNCNIIYRE